MTAPLASQAYARLWNGFRPSTIAAYRRMLVLFISFLVAVGLFLPQVDTLDILAFMEYLLQAGMTAANITNHLTAIRSCCIIYNIGTAPFRDNRLPLFIKSIKINRPLQPSWQFSVDENILYSICVASASLPFPNTFKALYLLAYFSFFRLSSVLPHSVATFDKSRHLCKGDVIFPQSGAVVVVKWTKTLQDRCKVASVSLPNLGASPLCPITALKALGTFTAADNDKPLFEIFSRFISVPLQILMQGSTLRKF